MFGSANNIVRRLLKLLGLPSLFWMDPNVLIMLFTVSSLVPGPSFPAEASAIASTY